jgi:hypothetical protein
MEGKSPTMRDDLYRRITAAQPSRRNTFPLLIVSGKLIAAVVHAFLNGSR